MISKKPLFLTILIFLFATVLLLSMFSFVNAQAEISPKPEPALQAADLYSGPTYTGELSLKSPKWNRVFTKESPSLSCELPLLDHVNNGQAYQAIPFQVTNTGPITVTVNPNGTSLRDTVLLIYCRFTALFPTKNGLAYDENDGLGDLSAFTLSDNIRLQTGNTYLLVISTDAVEYGTFQIDFSENIRLGTPDPLTCNGATVTFDYGPPPDWPVLNNHPDNPVEWSNLDTCGESANYAIGHGDAACASSELQGGGSGAYDTYLFSNVFSLENIYTATLEYWANYQNMGLQDYLDLEISTDGGSSWDILLSWHEDHGPWKASPGENVQIPLTPYGGYSEVQLRWHYYDPVGPVESLDWYVQLDDVSLDCSYPSIELIKTVSVFGGGCPGEDSIEVAPGTDVEYCYEVTNTGAVTFTQHTLTDSELGTIVNDFPFTLGPGDTSGAGVGPVPIHTTTINTGTWTASDPTGLVEASDTDTAEVVVIPPSIELLKTVTANVGVCPGEESIVVDPGTEVSYCYEVTNTGLTTLTLHTLTDSELGTIFFEFTNELGPGESAAAGTSGYMMDVTTVNTATWTAFNPGPSDIAIATDSATVYVNEYTYLPLIIK